MESAKTMFQLQSELIDKKVDLSVNNAIDKVDNAIDKVVQQIHELKDEMHSMKHEMRTEFYNLRIEMNDRFGMVENRLTAVETKLGMVNENDRRIRDHFVNYSFKVAWISVGIAITYLLTQFHLVLR